MDPKIWGPYMWSIMHSYAKCSDNMVTHLLQTNPKPQTTDLSESITNAVCTGVAFFASMCSHLPCNLCVDGFTHILYDDKPSCSITSIHTAIETATLQRWVYDVHNAVNVKNGVDSAVDFKTVLARYNLQPVSFSCTDVINVLLMFTGGGTITRSETRKLMSTILPVLQVCIMYGDPLTHIRSDPLAKLTRLLQKKTCRTFMDVVRLWKQFYNVSESSRIIAPKLRERLFPVTDKPTT